MNFSFYCSNVRLKSQNNECLIACECITVNNTFCSTSYHSAGSGALVGI